MTNTDSIPPNPSFEREPINIGEIDLTSPMPPEGSEGVYGIKDEEGVVWNLFRPSNPKAQEVYIPKLAQAGAFSKSGQVIEVGGTKTPQDTKFNDLLANARWVLARAGDEDAGRRTRAWLLNDQSVAVMPRIRTGGTLSRPDGPPVAVEKIIFQPDSDTKAPELHPAAQVIGAIASFSGLGDEIRSLRKAWADRAAELGIEPSHLSTEEMNIIIRARRNNDPS